MRQLKNVILVGAASLALATAGSIGPAAATAAHTAAKKKQLVVGVSMFNLQNQYWTEIVRGIKTVAGKKVKVVVTDPKDDAPTQVSDIENFITNKVDAIVLAGIDPAALDPVLKKARAAGIKVIAQSTKLKTYDTYVTVGELDMGTNAGEIAGQWIKDNLGGNAEVAVLNYPTIPQLIDRDKGIRQGVAKYAPNAKFVADASAATEEQGLAAAENILQAHPNLNAFVCINDNGCMGALQAAKAAGKTSKNFAVVGIGGDPSALKEMTKDNSSYVGTVDLQSFADGKLLMSSALKLIARKKVPKDQLVKLQKVVGAKAAYQVLGR